MADKYYFSFIDDVIWVFRDLARQKPTSVFDNPFFKILKNAHERYDLKTQLNLFYRTDFYYGMDEFTLSEMPDTYKHEFEEASDWLKLGFHSLQEFPDYPFINASYDDMHKAFNMVRSEVIRFAGEKSFAYGLIPHWLPVSFDGCRALYDCGVRLMSVTAGKTKDYDGNPMQLPYGHAGRLLQNRKPESRLFTRDTRDTAIESGLCSYNHFSDSARYDNDKDLMCFLDKKTGLLFKKLDDNFDLNLFNLQELEQELERRKEHTLMCIGNHEQYFFKDYYAYQSEYEEKIYTMAQKLKEDNRKCIFIHEIPVLSAEALPFD